MYRKAAPVILLALLPCGCSTASYTNSVGKFSDGASSVQSSFQSLVTQERDATLTGQTYAALTAGKILLLPADCGVPAGDPTTADMSKVNCTPYWLNQQRGQEPLQTATKAPNAVTLASSVADYGKALVTLAAAKDISDLKDAATKAAAAVGTLAAAVGGPAGAGGEVVVNFLSWLYGKYLDNLRFEQLRAVVEQADPLIQTASKLLTQDAEILAHTIVAERSVIVSKEVIRLAGEQKKFLTESANARAQDEIPLSSDTAAVAADSQQLQQLARTDFGAPFKAMTNAHQALKTSLEQPSISISDVYSQMSDFATQAGKLQPLFQPASGGKK